LCFHSRTSAVTANTSRKDKVATTRERGFESEQNVNQSIIVLSLFIPYRASKKAAPTSTVELEQQVDQELLLISKFSFTPGTIKNSG
jgi:hypothetical protein